VAMGLIGRGPLGVRVELEKFDPSWAQSWALRKSRLGLQVKWRSLVGCELLTILDHFAAVRPPDQDLCTL
jgi:hypothetical protein